MTASVLVAVGTDHHRFDRLIDWVDRWLADGGAERATVLVQHGASKAPERAQGRPQLDHATLQESIEHATVVVCHGGPATITEARRRGHLPICVPRDPALDEHVDGHQQLFVRRMAGAGLVRLAETEVDFRAALDDALARPSEFRLTVDAADPSGLQPGARGLADALRPLLPVPAPDRVPVVYLGGLGRSGSTLIERSIAQVDGMVCVGELVHLWERGLRDDELCGCGAPFSGCDFWHRVGKAAFGGWENVDLGAVLALKQSVDRTRFAPRLLGPRLPGSFERRVRRYNDLLTRLYRAVLEVSGAEVVVDASKHASTALLLARNPQVDLRVVHVVRDSPAVAYSWTREVPRPDSAEPSYMAAWSPTRTAVQWTGANSLLDLAAARGTPTLRVRYEDFVQQPRQCLEQVLTFLDRPDPLRFVQDRVLDLRPAHTVAGNPNRFGVGPVRVVADEGWRDALPERSRRRVSVLTAPLRHRYGYPSDTP